MFKTSKLKEISLSIGSGITPSRSNENYWLNGTIHWLKTEQLGEHKIYGTSEKITKLAVAVLTDSPTQVYWRVLKKRLKDEGNETVTTCNGLKLPALDGKMRLTDVADTEQLFRLIQSIPSPKAEPFKLYLAKVALKELEAKTGKKVVGALSAKTALTTKQIEEK